MTVNFHVNSSGMQQLNAKIANAGSRAENILAQQVKKDTSPFVPFLTGSLDQRTQVIGNTVVYPGPYARFLYYGKVMVDPETGSTWAKPGGTKVVTDRNLVFTKAFHHQACAHWFETSKALNLQKWLRVAANAFTKFGSK